MPTALIHGAPRGHHLIINLISRGLAHGFECAPGTASDSHAAIQRQAQAGYKRVKVILIRHINTN